MFDAWAKYGREPVRDGKAPRCSGLDELLEAGAREADRAKHSAEAIALRKDLLDPKYGLDKTPAAAAAMLKIAESFESLYVFDQAAGYFEIADAHVRAASALQKAGEVQAAAQLLDRPSTPRDAAYASVLVDVASQLAASDPERAAKMCRLARGPIDAAPIETQIRAHALLARVDASAARAEHAAVIAAFAKSSGGLSREATTSVVVAYLFAADEAAKREIAKSPFPPLAGGKTAEAIDRWASGPVATWRVARVRAIENAVKEYDRIEERVATMPPEMRVEVSFHVARLWGELAEDPRRAPIERAIAYDRALAQRYRAVLVQDRPRAERALRACVDRSRALHVATPATVACERGVAEYGDGDLTIVREARPRARRIESASDDTMRPIGSDGMVP